MDIESGSCEFYTNITKSSVIALREFLDSMSIEAQAKGITEEELLNDLEQSYTETLSGLGEKMWKKAGGTEHIIRKRG